MKNIVLIGMPGCGKTTLGKLLAAKLKREFYDADDVLEEREPYSIKEFFAQGEEVFREAEQRTAEFLAWKENCVIAAGGGVVKKLQVWMLMPKRHYSFYRPTGGRYCK